MTKQEAQQVAKEMERAGYNTATRHYQDGSYAIHAIDSVTGTPCMVVTVNQWAERQKAMYQEVGG